MKIAALQLNTQALSNSRLDYYLRICEQKGVKIVALAEYILNNFFTQLKQMPLELIKEQSEVKINAILEFSKNYSICIIAPVIKISNKKPIKTCLIAKNGKAKYLDQQILMPYSHWNEEEFFANSKKEIKLFTMKIQEFKIGIMFGFEAHFDEFFKKAKDLDLIILPTANTYNSNARWQELIKIRAFLNNVNILRINRIGVSEVDDNSWQFYGNSFLCDAYGTIVQELNSLEEVLICDISKPIEAKKFWQFDRVSKEIEKRIL